MLATAASALLCLFCTDQGNTNNALGPLAAGGASSGTGGSSNTGTRNLAGATADGGAAETGDSNEGGAAGAAGATGGSDCLFDITSSLSPQIPTVGIIEWSTDMLEPKKARVEFGLDTDYGMTAPVDLDEPEYRTLLLGMKASRTYHYRIVASNRERTCASEDFTLDTGPLANGLPRVSVTTHDASKVSGGFLITGQFVVSDPEHGAPAYILDADGDIVWWYRIGRDVTGARMSYDGKHIWLNSANVPGNEGANIHRVSLDGLVDEDFSNEFVGLHHQIAVLPDETVAFFAYDQDDCDDIKERSPDGHVTTIVNARDAHGGTEPCHVNNVQYSPEDDTLVFSDRNNDNYTKVTRQGEVRWVLGGSTSDFDGDGASWVEQHGVHLLGPDRLLMFNNGEAGSPTGSLAIEVLLDLENMHATREWIYPADPPITNRTQADVQRMPNGNTIVAYSTRGILHEVDSRGELVQELVWPIAGAYGFIEKRLTLYGPPPR